MLLVELLLAMGLNIFSCFCPTTSAYRWMEENRTQARNRIGPSQTEVNRIDQRVVRPNLDRIPGPTEAQFTSCHTSNPAEESSQQSSVRHVSYQVAQALSKPANIASSRLHQGKSDGSHPAVTKLNRPQDHHAHASEIPWQPDSIHPSGVREGMARADKILGDPG